MKWSSSQSVVYFVVICIIRVNTCMSLFPSDVAKFSLSMNATMGLRTELCFHKATEFLTAETDVSFFQTAGRRFCLSAVSGLINKVNQQSTIKTGALLQW